MHSFELSPYPADDLPVIKILGTVKRIGDRLSVHYEVCGEVEAILLPSPVVPARNNDLWKTTCFEFFLAVPDAPGYWEFNMSPSGEWNVYRMDEYRRVGFREEPAFQQLPFRFQKWETRLSLKISVDFNQVIQPGQKMEIGVSAVIQTKDGRETHWALAHPNEWASQPDFHLRESFVLEI